MAEIKDIKLLLKESGLSFRDVLNAIMEQGIEHYSKAELEHMIQSALSTVNARPPLREYKDRFFRLLFSDKKRLLSLYNALNHSNHKNEDDLIFVTLEFGICIGMRGDLAYVLISDLYLYEAQATKNKNMPLRMLFYVADMYRGRVRHRDLFKNSRVMIETPHFITFYNGDEDMEEDEVILKLSDSYMRKEADEEPELELKVRVLNINKGHNKALLDACESLNGYSELLEAVRRYRKDGFAIDNAVAYGINYCIDNNILKEFLFKHRYEVISMLKDFYTIEDYKRDLQEEVNETKLQLAEAQVQLEDTQVQLEDTQVQLAKTQEKLAEAQVQTALFEETLIALCREAGLTEAQAIAILVEKTGMTRDRAMELVGSKLGSKKQIEE